MEIKKKQFLGDRSLRTYTAPDEIREIGDWAFSGCRELKSISLPCCVERIGRDAFQGCDQLEEAYLRGGMRSDGSVGMANGEPRADMTREQAGLMALALRYFPEAALLIGVWGKGVFAWLQAWDEACIKYLDSPETTGFQPFWAGGEEDYEEDERKLEEHCRARRLIKAEMIVKRLVVMEEGTGRSDEGVEKRTIYEAFFRENDMALEYLKRVKDRLDMTVRIYEKTGVFTNNAIPGFLEELPEEAVELRAVLLKRVSGDGNRFAGIEELMLN